MKKKILVGAGTISIVLLCFVLVASLSIASAYDIDGEEFTNRKPITIDNTGNANDLTDYQLKITVNHEPEMQPGFDDLRFTDSGGNVLEYWVEDSIPSTSATVWVKVTSIPGDVKTTMWMYYGNDDVSSQSDGDATFDIFEDFDHDDGEWTEYDLNNKIELDYTTDHKLKFNNWIRTDPGYVYKSCSAQNFVEEYEICITNKWGNANTIGPGFSDTCGTKSQWQNGVGTEFYAGFGDIRSYIMAFVDGNKVWGASAEWPPHPNSIDVTTNTIYYVRLEKFEDRIKLSIFSDPARTAHIAESPKEVTADNLADTSFGYYYLVAGYTTLPPDNPEWTSGWMDNFRVREYAEPEPTVEVVSDDAVPQIVSVEILDVNDVPTNIFTPGDKVNVKATISNPSQYRDYSVSVSMNIDEDTDGSNGAIYDSHLTLEDWDTDLHTGEQNSSTWSWVVPSQTEAEKTYYVAVGIHDQLNYDDICYDCPGYMWDFDAIVGAKKVLDVPYVTQGKAPWCLLASATMLLRYYGEDSDLWQNADWLDWNCDDGLLACIDCGKEIGGGCIIQHPLLEGDDPDVPYNFQTGDWIFFAWDHSSTFGWIKDKIDNGSPLIFFAPGINHAVVIVGYDDRGENIVYVNDPSGYLVKRSSVQIGGYDYGYPFIKQAVKWDKVLNLARSPKKFIFIDSEESQKDPVVQLHLPFSGTGGCKIPYFPSDYVLPTYVDYSHFDHYGVLQQDAVHLLINEEGLDWDFPFPDSLRPRLPMTDYLHFKEVHITNSGQGRNYKAVFSIGENEYKTDPFYLGTGLDKTFNEMKLKLWNLGSGDYIPRIEIYVENFDGTYSSKPIKTVSLPSLSVVSEYPFIATVFSPVDLTITDPDGFVINKESSEIPNANYIEVDIDGDGDLDDQIIISQRKIGNYQITVTPEPDAEDTDTYTLEVTIGDTTIVLAEDVPIADIPAQPYIIESTGTTIIAAPVADSNGPYAGNEGSQISFDASGSYDPDGSIDLYEWDFDSDGVYDVSTESPTAFFTWGDDYTGTVELRVTDNNGLSDTDTASITVNNVAPTASFYVEQPEEFILPYHSLTFNDASIDAGWLDTHTATWDFGDGTIVFETLTPIGTTTAEHAYAEPGTYTVTLTVTDDDGGVGYHEEEVTVISAEEAAGMIIDQLGSSIVPPEAPKGVAQKIESAIDKLEHVIDFLDQGKYCDAIGKLDGMITQIEGAIGQVIEQRCSVKECKGKKCTCIADEDANELIESLEQAKEGAIAIRDFISAEHLECA